MSDSTYDLFLGSGNNIRQVLRTNYGPNSAVIPAHMSGATAPTNIYGGPAEQTLSFDTADLLGLLTAISVSTGLLLSADVITIPYNRRANGGTFAAGASHFALSATDGYAYLTAIAAAQDNPAVIASGEFLPFSTTGLLDPIAANKNTTLTAAAFVSQYDFGPVYFNSVQVPQAVGWSFSPGFVVRSRRFDGANFPTAHYLVRANPSITIVFEELDDIADVFSGLFATITTADVYARKRTDGGIHVVDATAEHVKLSLAGGISAVETLDVSEQGSAQVGVRLWGKTASHSTASAIP